MINYKLFSSLAIACFLACILVSCIAQEPPLRVGVVVWPGSESLYLARDLGYYKNTPIQLIDYPSDSEMMRSYRNGDLDAATLTLDEVWALAESVPDVRIPLIQDISNGGDAILGKPEIAKLQQLKGKRVGVETTALGAFELSRALEQVNMSPKDVKVVSLLVSDHEQAFKQNKIDAVVTYEPTVSKLLATGANSLFDTTQIPGEVLDILAMRESVITKQSKTVKILLEGWFRALDYLQKHPEDAAKRIGLHMGIKPEEFLKSLSGIRIPDVQENQRILGNKDLKLVEATKRISKFMVQQKLLKKPLAPTSVFDDRILKTIKPTIYKNNFNSQSY
jgi:NitT/TauT family transport system substrate-binding protein